MMWFGIEDVISNLVVSLLVELIIVIMGVIIGHVIVERWEEWRYGGWVVVLKDGEKELVRRRISPRKAKDILNEPAELSVFLKGVISPYARIHCDLIEEGRELGVLVEDRENRQFIIDLAKNLPRFREEDGREEDVL